MAKRGNTEGSIYKRQDGRWVAALTMPDGKRRNLYGKTRKEAGSKLAEAIHDRGKGLPVIPERQTVEDFLLIWLEGVKPSIRPSTFTRYEEYVRLHTIPIIGKVRMAKLNPQHIQSLYNQKLSEGLSATTVRHLHTVLHRSLDQAMRWNHLISSCQHCQLQLYLPLMR